LYRSVDDDLQTQVDRPGARITYTYYPGGNVESKTVLDTSSLQARTWSYTYNSFGRVLTEDGPRTDVSDITTYTYYNCSTGAECGHPHTIANAHSQTTTFASYNDHGQPLTIIDPNGVATTLTYDARQRLTSRSTAGETATYEYWPTGLLKKATAPDSSYVVYAYDAAHRLTSIEDGAGNRIEYTLDALGNRIQERAVDPSGALRRTHRRVFNELNQLSEDIDAVDTSAVTTVFGYDDNGNQTSLSAPLSRITTREYDELDRLETVTDPGGGVTQFGYDARDNMTSVVDPEGLTTTYAYSGHDDLRQQISPDSGTTTFTYDSGGNVKTRLDGRGAPAGTAAYTYDALNRVVQIVYADHTSRTRTTHLAPMASDGSAR
jgi:YD repeat-containing protein